MKGFPCFHHFAVRIVVAKSEFWRMDIVVWKKKRFLANKQRVSVSSPSHKEQLLPAQSHHFLATHLQMVLGTICWDTVFNGLMFTCSNLFELSSCCACEFLIISLPPACLNYSGLVQAG